LQDRVPGIRPIELGAIQDLAELPAAGFRLPGPERPRVVGREPLALGRDLVSHADLLGDRRLDSLGIARADPPDLVGGDPRLPLPRVISPEPAAEGVEPARLADPLRLAPSCADDTPEDPTPRIAEEPLVLRAVARTKH